MAHSLPGCDGGADRCDPILSPLRSQVSFPSSEELEAIADTAYASVQSRTTDFLIILPSAGRTRQPCRYKYAAQAQRGFLNPRSSNSKASSGNDRLKAGLGWSVGFSPRGRRATPRRWPYCTSSDLSTNLSSVPAWTHSPSLLHPQTPTPTMSCGAFIPRKLLESSKPWNRPQ